MEPRKQKLYCYVDETGQDARADVFIVVAIVNAEDQSALRARLEAAEQETGIGKRKWHKAGSDRRLRFLTTVFEREIAPGSLFAGVYRKPLPYFLPLLDTITKAITAKTESPYQAHVYVDGIDRKKARELTNALRVAGVSVTMVKGRRDESEPLIRLADRWAGCLRASREEDAESQHLVARVKQTLYLQEVTHT